MRLNVAGLLSICYDRARPGPGPGLARVVSPSMKAHIVVIKFMKSLRIILSIAFVVAPLLSPRSSLAQDTLRFAFITDLHFGKPGNAGEILTPDIWLREALHGISASDSRFILLGGDIIDSCNNALEYALFDSAMKTTLPWYPMPGNHDIGTDSTTIRMENINAWIGRGYGRGPQNSEFYGITVDSLAAFFVLNSQASVSNDPAVLVRADQQLAEMDSFFSSHASARQKFVCSHIPLFVESSNEADSYFNISIAYRKRIVALMDKHGVKTYLAGHRHESGIGRSGGITVFSQTALSFQLGDGNQRGYYVFTVTADSVLRAFLPLIPAGHRGGRW